MTDQQRNTLAYVLIGLVLVVFMVVQRALNPPPPPATQPAEVRPADSQPTGTRPAERPVPPPRPTTRPPRVQPAQHRFEPPGVVPDDEIVLGWTDAADPGEYRLQAVLTNRGAALRRLALADYRNVDRTGPLVLFGLDPQRAVFQEDPTLLPAAWPLPGERLLLLNDYCETAPHKTFNLEQAAFHVAERSEQRVVFETTVLPESLRIRKIFEVKPASYALEAWVEVTNLGPEALAFSYQLQCASNMPRETERLGRRPPEAEIEAVFIARKEGGGFRSAGKRVEKLKDSEDGVGPWGNVLEGERLTALGLANKYFALVLMPAEAADQRRVHFARLGKALDLHYFAELQAHQKAGNPNTQLSDRQREDFEETARINGEVWLVTRAGEVVQPGEDNRWQHHYLLYAGPKDAANLSPYANWGLPELVSYGMFGFISRGLVWLLHVFHEIPPRNYGLAIILLTIVVRAVMHPLSRKQAHSMRGLQTLKPQLDELKQRYKGDRQALGRAQMDLYKQHGYNPMSGCLPMLLQLPIFIALWRALWIDPALRQASFIPPITDLSRPDSLLPLGFSIPLIFTEITHIRLLPILSMAAMFLSQRLTPKPPTSDQQAASQKKMMVVMFVFFAVMLYNVASGLLLYITVSSFIGILEQWHIRKGLEKAQGAAPAPAAKGPAGLRGLLTRLTGRAAGQAGKSEAPPPRKSAAKRRRRR